MLASGGGRAATRGSGPVIELECGITVYPARAEQGRWRAVWHENGERQQCEAVHRQWSRKHAHTQRRLCERFAAPVIDAIVCQDITTRHMQQIVNAPSTPGEGGRVQGMISALDTTGLEGGYLASARLAQVHWQAGDRSLPPPRVSHAGESVFWVDPLRCPPTPTWPRSARRWPPGCTGTAMS